MIWLRNEKKYFLLSTFIWRSDAWLKTRKIGFWREAQLHKCFASHAKPYGPVSYFCLKFYGPMFVYCDNDTFDFKIPMVEKKIQRVPKLSHYRVDQICLICNAVFIRHRRDA